MTGAAEVDPDRVLVLTPTGRDGEMIRERLQADGMACEPCAGLQAVLAGISAGAGAVVVAQEALSHEGARELLASLEAQEPWSDIPVLLLAEPTSRQRPFAVTHFFERANVTLLQRPLGIQLFLSSVRSAVRARRRQYQMRDLVRELERAVQLSDTFVAILGHDLRTPLGAISLSAETIVRMSPDARALRPAGRILSSALRMKRMIEQILDFARVRQGHGIPLSRREADLGEVARQIVQEIEDANPQGCVLLTETGDLAGAWDADRLGQVVSNLADNAVQHGRQGEPVAVELDGSDPSSVCVRVNNTGGVPAQSLPTLFEPFKSTSVRAAAASTSTGLGLGLFIAREIARAHGGDISVRSAGDRTTFEVTLPRRGGS